MQRTAVVTGGTRGLGRAIALALRDSGCRVAASYHNDDEAARRMQDDTGIAVFRWDVGDDDACTAGLAQVAQALGPVDILVNNAGVTADAMFHKMSKAWWPSWRTMPPASSPGRPSTSTAGSTWPERSVAPGRRHGCST